MIRNLTLSAAACLMLLFAGTGASLAAPFPGDVMRNEDGGWMLRVETAAGEGSFVHREGAGIIASFRQPAGLAVEKDGTVLVADSRNHLIRTLEPNGRVGTKAGVLYDKDDKGVPLGGLLDGEADRSLFHDPQGMAVGSDGSVYVADAGNHAIRRIDPSGYVSTVAGSGVLGFRDGAGKEASFYAPSDVAVASDGTLYVADTLNHAIRAIDPDGRVTTLNAKSGRVVEATPGQAVFAGDYRDGDLAEALFNEPTSLVLDDKGNLYVSDSGNQLIRYIDLRQRTVTTVAGSAAGYGGTGIYEDNALYAAGDYADGPALKAKFRFPRGLAWTAEGGLLIADSENHAIRYLFDGEVTTLAGSRDRESGETDGTETGARFTRPTDIAVKPDGTVLIADRFNNKIRELAPYRLPAGPAADDRIKVALDTRMIEFEAEPEIAGTRAMAPVRALGEALGYDVDYDEADGAVSLSRDGETVRLQVGQNGIRRLVEGQPDAVIETDTAPFIKQGLTFVPIRFFGEAARLDVQWDEATRTAILRHPAAIRP